ncbi:MAG: sigma-54-dependent Fis family transcriptional regulator [Deltaproteobacteria bacterium]|nr:sigma-54-dependent Fis family transcriptional regulator [Deltaproteobacteria bacterium]MDQ3298404.1 sigma 54-interacting transcriptional regulator [Myxococcota bacterium]
MLRGNLKADDFLVAESASMRAVLGAIAEFADGDAPVVICGEHGTGRELVARVLHNQGPRGRGRFVAVRPTFEDVPCASGDDACERARRALRSASGGTLLVKDVSDMSAPSQRTLKRAIRDRAPAKPETEQFDVQVVATADLDLEKAVDASIVSRELYELFRPRRIEVPPLRDRLDDLPVLFERWIKHYAAEIGRTRPTVASRAVARLAEYPWPGNVGELKSIARRLVVRVTRNKIEAGDVDEVLPVVASRVPLEDLAFEEMVKSKLAGLLKRIDGYPVHDLYEKVLARVERPLFDLVLAHTGGNQLKAAEILGLNRNTLRKKLAELGMPQQKKRAGREDRALDGD